jgi:hypothetical protein
MALHVWVGEPLLWLLLVARTEFLVVRETTTMTARRRSCSCDPEQPNECMNELAQIFGKFNERL